MKRLLAIVAAVALAFVALGVVGWWRGMIALPFGPDHRALAVQLRDRGTVAVAGRVPFGLPREATSLVDYEQIPALRAALAGPRGDAVSQAMRAAHLDGLLVRTDGTQGRPHTALNTLSQMGALSTVSATYLDETAALYETRDAIEIDTADARRLIAVVRLILQGAVPPAERLFPPAVRRSNPTEVAVIVRDGHDPVLWRAVRGGSIARALVDATYAVLDRWNTRQQQHYGPLREAVLTHPLTIAIYYDRGTLGARTPGFLTRAINPRVYSIGYEQLGRWEYVLPPTPWAGIGNPTRAIQDLANAQGLAPPGFMRPEITLYRFRAYQLIERTAQGDVDVFDPT